MAYDSTNNNELVLNISLNTNDVTRGYSEITKTFSTAEQHIIRSVQNINKSISDSVGIKQVIEPATNAALRSLERLEARAAIAGKTIRERLEYQRSNRPKDLGDDPAVVNRYTEALNRLIEAERRREQVRDSRQRAVATRAEGLRAGQAVLPGQEEFESAFKKYQANEAAIQSLQRSQRIRTETPAQRIDREEAETIAKYGRSPRQQQVIRDVYANERVAAVREEAAAEQRLIAELEREGALYGKTKKQRLEFERDELLAQHKNSQSVQTAIRDSYAKQIKTEEDLEKGHGNVRRLILAGKDFAEGYTRGGIIEVTDYFIGTGGQGGVLRGASASIKEFTGLSTAATIAVGGLYAGIAAVGLIGVKSFKAVAEAGREFTNISERTGLRIDQVQNAQFAARAVGLEPNSIERVSRGFAQLESDDSAAGKQGRKELANLGIELRDQYGVLKPTQEILLETSDALNKLGPGSQAAAASLEIFKRAGIELLPFLKEYRENTELAQQQLGGIFTPEDQARAKEYERDIALIEESAKRLGLLLAKPFALVVKAFFDEKDFSMRYVGIYLATEVRRHAPRGLAISLLTYIQLRNRQKQHRT